MGILIRNAKIVSMDEEVKIINNGYVLIQDKNIVEVAQGEFQGPLENFKIIEGNGYCVMPGLINCHTHAAMTLLRGYGEGYPLMTWLNEKIWPMEAKFKKKHIEIGTKIACLEMLKTGTTTFSDMYFMQDEVFKVTEEFNMKAVLGIPIIGDDWESQLISSIDLAKEIKKSKGLAKTMIAPHSPYTLSEEALREIGKVSKENNYDIHIHIAETLDEINIIRDRYNMTPCDLLEKTGIFDNKVVAAHCVHLNDNDLDIIKNKSVSAVYNPQSNMKLASGTARVVEMLERGINVCLGTDGTSSNNNLNLFEEMETGALLQKLWYKDATKLDGETTLKFATINGAKALGLEKVGRIKEGYKADLIMVNLNKPNMTPCYDIYSNLVFSANGSEVETVIIEGKIIMHKGEFISIDEEKLLYECNKICGELI